MSTTHLPSADAVGLATTHERAGRGGIVARVDSSTEPAGADLTFTPDYTVTSTDDKGGRVLTNVEVILIFWGSFWSATPAPSPSRDQYEQAMRGIVTGPYMGELAQYRGVGQGRIVYSEIFDGTDPANGYTDDDLVAMLKGRFANNTAIPRPATGHNRFYVVILPQGIDNSLSQTGPDHPVGQHRSFSYNGITGYYAWVDNTGSLTGSNCTTKVFSHELVEACTDPDGVDTPNYGILVQGKDSQGKAVTNDEIGDTCSNNSATATVDMNGIVCTVQSYWSKSANSCVLPVGSVEFWVDKDTFGKNEIQDLIATTDGKIENAFWLVVEGFSKTTFASLHVTTPTPTGGLTAIPGVSVAPNGTIDFENAARPGAQQRIRVGFDITFSAASLPEFPLSGSQTYDLSAFLATDGMKVASTDTSTLFELVAGADPYFTNIDVSRGNVYYLSQDLRVFTATPAQNGTPVPGGPAFVADTAAGAYDYAQKLLAWLNANFSNPEGIDPFTSMIPGQLSAFSGDSSVTPYTVDFTRSPPLGRNYQFAVARVRLRESVGIANAVRVFFRLWSTQTPDADYQPSTYPSTTDAAGFPAAPQVGAAHVTLPLFASGNLGANTDYGSNGANTRDMQIPDGQDSVWAYFGCFLNLYDGSYVIDGRPVQGWLNGTHHCLVAQIAYDGSPIFTGATPMGSDKMAQRNLQITHSDNPGPVSAHRIPQTFDVRPSPLDGADGADELMIDWGQVPAGSVASIFWPQIDASEVVDLASATDPAQTLTAADPHTLRCEVTGGVTYVPIPARAGENFAGLLTIDLPTSVQDGDEFDVIIRRLGHKAKPIIEIEKIPTTNVQPRTSENGSTWRYVIGAYAVKVPVATAETMLYPEENTLAIMRWRLDQLSSADRWRPVLTRYVEDLAGRVSGLGGDPHAVLPSPDGVPLRRTDEQCGDVVEHSGRVTEVVLDCHGRIEGFVTAGCCDHHEYTTRDFGLAELVLRAYQQGLDLVVVSPRRRTADVMRIVVRA